MKHTFAKCMQFLLFTLVLGMAMSLFEANAFESNEQTIESPAGD